MEDLARKKGMARIKEVDELQTRIEDAFDGDSRLANRWLRTPLLELGGKAPLECIHEGRVKRVMELLTTFEVSVSA